MVALVAIWPFVAVTAAESCTSSEKSEIMASYGSFRRASREGNLQAVKALSTKDVVRDISSFETSVNDPSVLARQMGAFSPDLQDAKEIKCEVSGDRSRLIARSETRSEDKATIVAQVFSVVMFQKLGKQWLVGVKASTNPFKTEPLNSLLVHDQLKLP